MSTENPEETDPLSRRIDQLTQAVHNAGRKVDDDRKLRIEENKQRDKRIKYSQRAIVACIIAVVVSLGMGLAGLIVGYNLATTRAETNESICSFGNGMVNSLIKSSQPKTQEDYDKTVAAIKAFEIDLEQRSGNLHCDLHLITPNPPAPTTTTTVPPPTSSEGI